MKDIVVNKILNYIKNNKKISKQDEEVIIYGLESLYLFISKMIIISIIAIILGIFKEFIIFFIFFNIIRTFAFGLHANKSYICLIVSIIFFIGLPYLSTIIVIPKYHKIIIGILLISCILKNSPADTLKRPIVNKKRRLKLKIYSTIISIIYVIISFFTTNFVSNCLLFSLLLEAIFISPLVYKIFKLPYNNYLTYLKEEEENVFS